jgi:RNA polymerase sigma-70 factor (ECF subfamily)
VSDPLSSPDCGESQFVMDITSHQGVLHAFLVSMLPGQAEVDDILQRANLVLWEKRANFTPGSSFKAWALAVAYWEARAWMTERKRVGWLVFDDELTKAIIERFVAQPDEAPHAAVSALRVCLGKLRDSDRLLVLSHHYHHKSLRECAEIFNRNADSLKASLVRIRAALRRCIKSQIAIHNPAS